MKKENLGEKLLLDLSLAGLDIKFNLDIRGYSKNHYGKFDPNKDLIILYPYKDKSKSVLYPYKKILLDCLHEAIHYMQWKNPNTIRYKGLMHDAEFYRLYQMYKDKIEDMLFFQEVKDCG